MAITPTPSRAGGGGGREPITPTGVKNKQFAQTLTARLRLNEQYTKGASDLVYRLAGSLGEDSAVRHVAAFAVGFGLLMLSLSGASAAETVYCSAENQLPHGTYRHVDAGAGCVLEEQHILVGSLVIDAPSDSSVVVGSHVLDDVAVFGGNVEIDGARVGGSIYAISAANVTITNSWVGGDIWNTCSCLGSSVANNDVDGSVLLDGAGSELVVVTDNVIGGDLFVQNASGGFNIDRNRVGGHFRLAGSIAHQGSSTGASSTVHANHVDGRFELSRNRVNDIFDEGPDAGPALVVSTNVVQGHAGVFQNGGDRGLEFLNNQIGGALVCSSNTDLVHSGNTARTRFGECTD